MENLVILKEETLNEFNRKLDSILSRLENKQEAEKQWLTCHEAMELLGIKQTTLWAYRRDGQLTFTKINRKVFLLRADILRLMEQNKTVGYKLKSR